MGYKTREWRKSMRVTVDYNNMMSKFLGERGIKDSELRAMKGKAEEAFDYVARNAAKTSSSWDGRNFPIIRTRSLPIS